ncbi:MAG: divergent polysaccharide deacetylase family protein, partial [Tabrizicola sp.]
APATEPLPADLPATEAPPPDAPAVEAPVTEPPAAPLPDATPAPESAAEVSPDPVPGTAVPAMPGSKPAALPGTAEPDADGAATAEVPGNGSSFKPAPGLVRAGEGVIIGRDKPTDAAAADPAVTPEDPRPIAQFAVPFENPEAKPPFAIVLVDPGTPDLDRAGLAALPFPVSFALDPLDPATPERAAIYRAAGKEVLMLVTGIAEGAQASDVEVAFQSMEQGLPEAVAVMDLADPAFQNNRSLASAVVPILKAEGRGLLSWDEGLNAADQIARRDDLEAAVIFRNLDEGHGDKVALRRLLDRAVFKADQAGRVSIVGTADPATVAALLEWTVEGKAATVALAPLTAVLKVD